MRAAAFMCNRPQSAIATVPVPDPARIVRINIRVCVAEGDVWLHMGCSDEPSCWAGINES
jgi:hypothetical protein